MKSQRLLIVRSMAILLSASVVWLMVACISLCASHCAEPQETCEALSSDEIDAAHEGDCCPITRTPVSSMPERLTLNLQVSHAEQATAPPAAQILDLNCHLSGRIEVPYPSSSPPLSQLCVLRI
jgi:hypothetical protein